MEIPEAGDPFFSYEHGLLVRRGPRDAVPYAVFDGICPTSTQAREVISRGYGMHLMLSNSDLRFLSNFPTLTHLSVNGYGLDTRVISDLHALESLYAMVAEGPETDLSGLSRLRRYFGFLQGFESVQSAPALEVAEFHEVNDGSFGSVPRQLHDLTLHSARKVHGLTLREGAGEPELRDLYAHGSRRFDVSSLQAFPHLERITLEGIIHVEKISALSEMSSIKHVSVIRCRSADGLESLANIRGLKVLIVGKLGQAVRELAGRADPPWNILDRL